MKHFAVLHALVAIGLMMYQGVIHDFKHWSLLLVDKYPEVLL